MPSWLRFQVMAGMSGRRSALLAAGLILIFVNAQRLAAQETAPLPRPVAPPPTAPESLPSVTPPCGPFPTATTSCPPPPAKWVPPAAAPCEQPLPINLATALKLTNVRAWDIAIAGERVQIAAAQLQSAKVLWLPTLYNGVDYLHHEGTNQNLSTAAINDISRSSMMVGTAPFAVFATTDAIFEPLATKQLLQARQADLQAVTNDTTLAVALGYFDVEEARGDLASILDVLRRAHELVERIDKLAPEMIPRVEATRARTQLARLEQMAQSARERWRVVSAELARILRLGPEALLEPVEPPHLQITLIAPERCPADLLELALTLRPELAASQALVKAALQRWREEKFRPLLPMILARGAGTQTPYPMAFGTFGGGQGSSLSNFGLREDWDLQALWELRNLGLGNRALIRGRRAEHDQAEMQLMRTQDFVGREVMQAYAQLQSAVIRVGQAEQGLKDALTSAQENYEGLGQVKRVGGNIVVLVIRPQEALAALQDLTLAYYNYYGAVADYNRAQFRLYRAMGNPAQQLPGPDGLASPPGSRDCCSPEPNDTAPHCPGSNPSH